MIPRYSLPEIADLFTDEARFAAWLEVEVLAVEAWAELGVVPVEHARVVRERAGFDVQAIHEREKITDHDVAAFVDIVQATVGAPAGGWVHYGLTSSDVVDTALALQMTRAMDHIIGAAATLEATIAARAREFRDTPMVGRTHGIHAEPTTFGVKLALWAMQVRRDRERLQRARDVIAVGKLSGAVGTYSNVDPFVEKYVCEHLGLEPVPATQVLARDRHAEVMYACASLGATVESFAVEIRHLQRTEVREVEEPFREGEQKGSSAMPHKRNPVKSEQLSGLARVLARQPAGRARGCRAVARARHLALFGRAGDRPRLADARVLPRGPVHDHRARDAACTRNAWCATSTRRSAWCSASRCCSRSSSPGSRAMTRTAWCNATRCGPGRRSDRSASCWPRTRT